jgi:Tfp pilus assembly protein PilX
MDQRRSSPLFERLRTSLIERVPAPLLARVRARHAVGDRDAGYILVIVMGVSVIILSFAAVAMQSTLTNQSVTATYTNAVQSRLASESGLNAALAADQSVPAASSLTCSSTSPPTSPPGSWSYSTTMTYASSTGTAMTCPLSAWPATTEITSIGTTPHGAPVAMVEDATITAPSTPTTTLLPALNYAMFTTGQLQLSAGATIQQGASGQSPDVVAGSVASCTNSNALAGNLYSYSTSTIDLNSGCTITKGLYAAGPVTMSGGATVGSVTSYGSGGIALNGGGTVTGIATSTGGNIALAGGSPSIGSAYAYGNITWNSANVSPTNGSNYIGFYQANDTALANSPPMQAEPAFPAISDPTQSQWAGSGYTNYIVVGINGTTVNGVPLTVTNNYGQTSAYTCDNFFAPQYNVGGVSSSPSEFAAIVNGATTPTVIDAPLCPSNYSLYPLGGNQTYSLQTNVALVINGISFSNTNTFTSSSNTSHDFSIIVPAPDTGTVTLSNSSTFSNSLSTFIYTEGSFNANSSPNINGQVLAGLGASGGANLTNNFALTFSNAASQTIPGTTTITNGAGNGSPTIVGVRRYIRGVSGPQAPATAPAAPTIGTASVNNTTGAVTVNWTDPANNGSAITGYTVTPSPACASCVGTTANGPTVTSATISGLTLGTAYTFQVSATNGIGTSTQSAASNAVTPVTAPAAPAIGSASLNGATGAVTVTWTDPANNGSAITGYTVTPSPTCASCVGTTATGATATSATITGLTLGTAYSFQVSAINGIGTSSQSAASNSITAGTVPGAPTGVTARAPGVVSWTAPPANGSPITSYTVTAYINGASQGTQSFATTSGTFSGLKSNKNYTFTVSATNAIGTSGQSIATSPAVAG